MSVVRRVKSFSAKKNAEVKSSEEVRLRHRTKKKDKFDRQKSMSLEWTPRLDFEQSDLFQRQKLKAQKYEEDTRREHRFLNKRDSVSLDDTQFLERVSSRNKKWSRYNTVDVIESLIPYLISQYYGLELPMNTMYSVEQSVKRQQKAQVEVVNFKKVDNGHLTSWKSESFLDRSKSRSDWYINFDDDDDLINNIDETQNEAISHNRLGNFPVFEEEEVEIRHLRAPKLERPKTCSPQINVRKKEECFDVRGPFRIEIGTDKCIRVLPEEVLRLKNGYLQVLDETGRNKSSIGFNVQFKKLPNVINKKEVESIDSEKTVYRFKFETSEDAKQFVEAEKIRLATSKNSGTLMSQFIRLLKKRSSKDILEEKGILKNEPVFGNTLEELCDEEHPVPEVVTRIVTLIEEPQNIRSEGLYRASANLAVVQNIRFEINCGRYEILDKHRTDVDVLAGTLKLFFRELKEPLIPEGDVQELCKPGNLKHVVNGLPLWNKNTLLYIIRHLIQVCHFKEFNKMDFHNLAICWGPSLITFSENSVDLVAQTAQFTAITEDLLRYYSEQRQEAMPTLRKLKPSTKPDFVYDVVKKLIDLIEQYLHVEGLYRKSGSNVRIEKIMKIIASNNLVELDLTKHDIHDLCCVLKKFLLSLREPLITNEMFTQFCDTCDKSTLNLTEEVHNMVEKSPRSCVIFLLMQHLRNVVKHEGQNKMSMTYMTNIWMTTLTSFTAKQYKINMLKFTQFFQILINLNERVLPDLLAESDLFQRIRERSTYENVPVDINLERHETRL